MRSSYGRLILVWAFLLTGFDMATAQLLPGGQRENNEAVTEAYPAAWVLNPTLRVMASEETSYHFGFTGLRALSRHWGAGISFYTCIRNKIPIPLPDGSGFRTNRTTYNNLGAHIEYNLRESFVTVTLGTSLGLGFLRVGTENNRVSFLFFSIEDIFYYVEPMVGLNFPLSGSFMIRAEGGYRAATGLDSPYLRNVMFGGFFAGLGLRFDLTF